MATVLEQLTGYIRSEMDYHGPLPPDLDLLESRVLDSFSIVQVATFIQESFGIELEPEDLVRANLSRLSSMVSLVERKKAATS